MGFEASCQQNKPAEMCNDVSCMYYSNSERVKVAYLVLHERN